MELTTCSKTKEELIEHYNNLDEDERKLLETSYETVSETNACESRIEEIKLFCKKLGYKKIGIAFCKGLRKYGEALDKELSTDFEVYSVCCNICNITKESIDVNPVKSGEEPACNPVGQALALNGKEPDLVIKCGFCIGHDMLFSKMIKAPTTTLFVKDRKYKHRTIDSFD